VAKPASIRRPSLISPPKNPCWRDGLVMHGKPLPSRGSGSHPFGLFERPELDHLATSTATIAMQQMGSQYQPDAPARESTSNYFATEEPLLARRAGNARQTAVVARSMYETAHTDGGQKNKHR
jgi:hypothetical protein